jgi:alpha-glucuronidase
MIHTIRSIFIIFYFISAPILLKGEDGYELWLRYVPITDQTYLSEAKKVSEELIVLGSHSVLKSAEKELQLGLKGMLQYHIPVSESLKKNGTIIIGIASDPLLEKISSIQSEVKDIGEEGFLIRSVSLNKIECTVITANNEAGVLYGVFHFLKQIQTRKKLSDLFIKEKPALKYRLLNHWDNLDRTVERGYAGFSLWDWHRLPGYIDFRYRDYARANASIGINGTVITNVNANALVLTEEYLHKVAALADVFRNYGIKVYLTARFNAPIEIGKLKTADPLDAEVKKWWKEKTEEIYKYIPDFGGFLVKANSEGQPGPQNYGCTHADGANMLAEALAPYQGIVMWRAFVYDNNVPEDRVKQAFNEFIPLDGKFRENVFVQVKNGPLDFQPREPFHPLFGGMKQTPLMMEFQITQEYLGFATHLVYLGKLFEECLRSKAFSDKGNSVAEILEGGKNNSRSGIAGVSNIGTDRNWCGHPFAQANWYSFGRLAWNPYSSSETIAEDWLRMTFSNDKDFIDPVLKMMIQSRETAVKYMTPLGLHHIMGWSHHYGPAPWIRDKPRADWTSVYYHQADSAGIGFNRTGTGSKALDQYHPEIKKKFENPNTCPKEFLLWFHHLPWNYKMPSGNTLWRDIVDHYYQGVDEVRAMQKAWEKIKGKIDNERFEHVKALLAIQEKEAVWWRNACVLYFQTFSKMQIPDSYEKPDKNLEYYMKLEFHFVPGN